MGKRSNAELDVHRDALEGAHNANNFKTHIELLYRTSMPGVLGALAAALILVGVFILLGGLSLVPGIIWGGLLGVCVLLHLILRFAYDRDPEHFSVRTWARAFTFAALLDGLWWGGATKALPASDQFEQQALVVAVALVVAAGAVPAFASHLPAFLAIFLPISLLSAFWQIEQVGVLHQAIVVLVGVFIPTILSLALRSHRNLAEMIRLRHEREQLVTDLRQQIILAEQANNAKSRFLASASHDLRQPVHALGMFVSALERLSMTPEMRETVAHIEESTQAMEKLLNSMLDISRLDAGVVEPRLQVFPINAMIERICGEWLADAAAKGLTLRICRSSAHVESDPLLLERIIRNLVSNAVRYTHDGKVLVGCRRVGGMLQVEVWDTGQGISSTEHERIFEEFYQVGNQERDRSQGLGLGLSIVRRLSDLLGHPVTFESTPNEGTVFRVQVPSATPSPPTPERASVANAVANSLRDLTVAIVDDDPQVLEGMRSMLLGWEAEVVAAASGEELLERIRASDRSLSIILCDYRLRAGEDGTEVIRRVHEWLGYRTPAILITGDTASDRVRLAHDSGFHVLYKPIAPGKLRALIGNMLKPAPVDGE